MIITCPTILYGEQFARGSKKNIHAYRLDLPITDTWVGVFHGTDVYYLFIIPRFPYYYSNAAFKLSKDMIRAWSQFAYTGQPGKMENIPWTSALNKKIENSTVSFMSLDSNNYRMVDNFYQNNCDNFWKNKIFKLN